MTLPQEIEKAFRAGKRRVVLAAVGTFALAWPIAMALGVGGYRAMTTSWPTIDGWLIMASVAIVPAAVAEHIVLYMVAKRALIHMVITIVTKQLLPHAAGALGSLVFAANPLHLLDQLIHRK